MAKIQQVERASLTPERKAKLLDEDIDRDPKGREWIRDNLLDQLLTKRKLTRKEFQGGSKFRELYDMSRLEGNLKSLDMGGVASAVTGRDHLGRTENEVANRIKYQKAREFLHSDAEFVESLICTGYTTLESEGKLQYRARIPAYAFALGKLKTLLNSLARHFGFR